MRVAECSVEIAMEPAMIARDDKPSIAASFTLDANSERAAGRELKNDSAHDAALGRLAARLKWATSALSETDEPTCGGGDRDRTDGAVTCRV
jgi:hypothetical protein